MYSLRATSPTVNENHSIIYYDLNVSKEWNVLNFHWCAKGVSKTEAQPKNLWRMLKKQWIPPSSLELNSSMALVDCSLVFHRSKDESKLETWPIISTFFVELGSHSFFSPTFCLGTQCIHDNGLAITRYFVCFMNGHLLMAALCVAMKYPASDPELR